MSAPRRARRAARSGFTLVEIVIAVALLGLIASSASMLSLRTNEAARVMNARNVVQTDARRVADRIARAMQGTALGVLVPDPGALGTADLTFQTPDGAPAGVLLWGESTRVRLQYEPSEANNGADDDGDGLVDEGQVVLTRDVGGPTQMDVVLCRGVTEFLEGETPNAADDNGNGLVDERGFVVTRTGNMLVLRFTVGRPLPEGQMVLSTVETAVLMRN